MIHSASSAAAGRRFKTSISIVFSLAAVLVFFMTSGFISYWNTKLLSENTEKILHEHEVILALDNILSLMKDAETGQRGFLLTGDEKYLEPFFAASNAIDAELSELTRLTKQSPEQQTHIQVVKTHITAKFNELNETIQLRRTKSFDAALAVVKSDLGKREMDIIRDQLRLMRQEEENARAKRIAETASAYQNTITSNVLACLLGVLLSCVVAYLLRRAAMIRQRQEWFQSGQVGLSSAMAGEQRTEQLGDNILSFLASYLDAHAGIVFVKNNGDYHRIASYGVPADSVIPDRFKAGDGLLGQTVKDGKPIILHDVDEGYIRVGSALGQGTPKHLMICPVASDNIINAVLELGFIHPLDETAIEFIEKVSEAIAIAVRSASYRSNLQNLLEETQRQAEELQAQSEEVRVANEELEEQSRALKASQSSLEQQQTELEQTNSQLEEQSQLLETQRDDLAKAQAIVQLKVQELEQASRYKSDFLANMSHELRTPLNSSLILAKLLADNPLENLTDEQVRYAQTIQSAGNDLLNMINDILDLSKIEAGYMEIRPESLPLTRLMNDLTHIFQPVAQEKALALQIVIQPECPEIIETDRQRLEQILKNLLSNALKFTERGNVTLTVSRESEKNIAFAVSDTGIGIALEEQQVVFDAFRQADGTISRKYGGTGLGLSISRELARLLGGNIQLKSTPGEGSTFTLIIPATYDAAMVTTRPAARPAAVPTSVSHEPTTSSLPKRVSFIEDDREKLTNGSRSILVVEDDESFARILYELIHEIDFQCLIATNAEEALATAKQYLPNAIVLDIGLPDHSGLSVLDLLKRNIRTRHIPIHVVSGGDYAQTALSLGAVGYMLKPVKREMLVDALKNLETRLMHGMRRVLIVEDDEVQRDSVARLLASRDVQTVEASTAAECLERLKETTFDCMVLDLSLPDATGYSLLETLSKEDAYSFPPVIVYTGRDLSADEELRLRRYSKSIIIKGAKSPERLLDEVTLFLHKVVSELPPEQQRMLQKAQNRDAIIESRNILVVEDDVRNVYALTSMLEPCGAVVSIARNGREGLDMLTKCAEDPTKKIDLVLMDVMMPEMDGLTATREIRKHPEWKNLPIIMLTAKAMKDDQERCLEAGANDYMAKPLDVEKLLSLVRVWMPR